MLEWESRICLHPAFALINYVTSKKSPNFPKSQFLQPLKLIRIIMMMIIIINDIDLI